MATSTGRSREAVQARPARERAPPPRWHSTGRGAHRGGDPPAAGVAVMTAHGQLVNRIRLALSHGETRLFVNPRGVAVYEGGARVEYGLAPGASDLIGITRGGRLVAIEVKVGRDKLREDQA